MYNLKSIREDFKAKGIFYTPPELAEYLKTFCPEKPQKVYDPTCGAGALLAVFPDDVKKYGQEINEPQLKVAQESLVNFVGYCGDTLQDPGFKATKFDTVVANPPFSVKWNPPPPNHNDERFLNAPTIPTAGRADYAFLLHILHYLSDDGVAVVLNAPGILYRGGREGVLRRWFVEQNYIDKVVRIPGNAFVDTKIETALLVLKKNKTTPAVEFLIKDSALKRTVAFEEIKANDFNLSVNFYLQEELPKAPEFDVKSSFLETRKALLKSLKSHLEMEKMMCELDPNLIFDGGFLNNVISLVEDFKRQ